MNNKKANKITGKILAVILEEINGYSPEEIINDSLVDDCYGSDLWTRIEDILKEEA